MDMNQFDITRDDKSHSSPVFNSLMEDFDFSSSIVGEKDLYFLELSPSLSETPWDIFEDITMPSDAQEISSEINHTATTDSYYTPPVTPGSSVKARSFNTSPAASEDFNCYLADTPESQAESCNIPQYFSSSGNFPQSQDPNRNNIINSNEVSTNNFPHTKVNHEPNLNHSNQSIFPQEPQRSSDSPKIPTYTQNPGLVNNNQNQYFQETPCGLPEIPTCASNSGFVCNSTDPDQRHLNHNSCLNHNFCHDNSSPPQKVFIVDGSADSRHVPHSTFNSSYHTIQEDSHSVVVPSSNKMTINCNSQGTTPEKPVRRKKARQSKEANRESARKSRLKKKEIEKNKREERNVVDKNLLKLIGKIENELETTANEEEDMIKLSIVNLDRSRKDAGFRVMLSSWLGENSSTS